MINLYQSLFIQLSSCLTDGTNKLGGEMQIQKNKIKKIKKYKNTKDEGGKVGRVIKNTKSIKYKIKIVLETTSQMGQMRRERKCKCEAKSCRNTISIGIIPVQLFAKLAKSWNSTNYHSERCFPEGAISIYL